MQDIKANLMFENLNYTISYKMMLILGFFLLITAYGNSIEYLSLSLGQEETLEFANVTLTCSYNGSETSLFPRSMNFTNGNIESTIRLNGDACIATGFLNDSKRFSWTCNENSSFSLTMIRITRAQHNESWRCSHDSKLSNNISLFVKVPVDTVSLYEEDGNNVTVMENERISFSCNTSYCRPAAKISWFICPRLCKEIEKEDISDGANSSSIKDRKGFVSTQSSLEFSPDRSKHGWHVFCSASNLESSNVSSSALTFNIIYPPRGPPKIHGIENKYRVIENRLARLSCSVSEGNPLPDLVWECYNGSSTMTRNESTIASSVSWTAKREQNEKCVCRSIHVGGNQSAEVYLDVLYPPDVLNLTIGSTNVKQAVSKIVNTSLAINCNGESNPAAKYNWSKQNTSVSRGEMLNISHITMSNNGTYNCRAENLMTASNGNTERGISDVSIEVHVLFPPTTPELRYGGLEGPLIQADSLFVVEYDSVIISCSSSGNPEPRYTWSNTSIKKKDYIELTNITQDINVSCTATNTMNDIAESREGKSEKGISVIAFYPPRTPVIRYDFNGTGIGECTTENGQFSVQEYTSFFMVCQTEAKPDPHYSWYGPIQSAFQDLEVHSISRDKKGNYSCNAFNTMERSFGEIKTGESQTNVRLNILYPPTIGQLNNLSVLEGSIVNISCPFSPGNPVVTNVSWTRNVDKSTWTSGKLYLNPLKKEDGGIYKCSASNIMKPSCADQTEGIVSNSFHLNVVYKTTVSKFYVRGKSDLNKVTLHENDSLELVCETESKPISSIRIAFDGDTMISKSSVNTLTFIKAKVSCSDHGIYACYGSNIYNVEEPAEKYLTLHISCSPRPFSSGVSSDHIFSSEGKTETLTFATLAFPIPEKTGYKWLKEQQESIWTHIHDSTRLKILSSGIKTSLTISDLTDNDFGKYKLVIENSIGIFDKTFHLLREAPPAMPTHLEVINDSLTNTSVTISWKRFKGYNKGQTFIIQYKEETDKQFSNISVTDNIGPSMNYTITDLVSSARYLLQISAVNAFGRSDNLALWFQMKSKPSPPKKLSVIEESTSDTFFTIQWTPGYDGGDVQTFVLHYKIKSTDVWETRFLTFCMGSSGNATRQYIVKLETGLTYELYLTATNRYGNSDKSETITVQTNRLNAMKCEVRQSIIIWILTGLLALFAVVVISVVTMICIRRKHICRRGKNRSKSKHERMTGKLENITNVTYEEMKPEKGTEMVDLRQQYEELGNLNKDKTSSINFGIYEDIQIPKQACNESGNEQKPDGYEVPQASSDKKKLIVNKKQKKLSLGKLSDVTEYVSLDE